MLLWLLRGAYVVLLVGLAIFTASVFVESQEQAKRDRRSARHHALRRLVLFTDVREKQKQITTISAIYFGLLLGLLIGWLFSMALRPLFESAFPNKPQVVQRRPVC